MKRLMGIGFLAAGLVAMTWSGAGAAPIISGSVGGAPIGVQLDNLDWLVPGSTGAGWFNPLTGITVNFFPDAKAVQGGVSGKYAPPFLSGGNGTGFGSPDQPDGPDATTYITTGSYASVSTAKTEILLGANYRYFGLLWGSVDTYNTLAFYDGGNLLFSVTGSQVKASPNGDQGVNGTLYVNILNDLPFNRVVATSSSYAFEFDNLALSRSDPNTPVPEPASMVLLGSGLIGLAGAARRRMRK